MYKFLVIFLALGSCAFAAKSSSNAAASAATSYYGYTATSGNATAPATPKNIIRPCHPITLECVRENLAANSRCRTTGLRLLPKSYQIDKFTFEAPYFNASYVDRNLIIQNQHMCRISEFFYNLKKDVAVLTVDCPGLTLSSNRTLIQHTSGKEDNVYSFTSTWYYPLIRLTVNINNADVMDLCKTFVFADVAAMPKFVLTPNDKSTKNFLSYDLSKLYIYERESFLYRGRQLFLTYINSVVCDFGC